MSKSFFGGILSPSQSSNDRQYVHSKFFNKQNHIQHKFNHFDQDIFIYSNASNKDLLTMTGHNYIPNDLINNALFNINNIFQRPSFLYFNPRHVSESLAMLCIIGLLLIIILFISYRKIGRKYRQQTVNSLNHSI